MARKPKLPISLCGLATSADFSAMLNVGVEAMPGKDGTEGTETAAIGHTPTKEEEKRLIDLAAERERAVRNYLTVGRNIAAQRLHACRTTYNIRDKQPPRAEIVP